MKARIESRWHSATRRIALFLMILGLLVAALTDPAHGSDGHTRGLGIYPGDPAEDFAPALVPAPAGPRNLSRHRATTQSSAWDYQLVAQLVTDGIVETTPPRWLSVSTPEDGALPKHTQAFLVDDNLTSGVNVREPGWIGFELGSGDAPLAIDRVEVGLKQRDWLSLVFPQVFGLPGLPEGRCMEGFLPGEVVGSGEATEGAEDRADGNLEWSLAASSDGRVWQELGRAVAAVPPTAPPPPLDGGFKAYGDWTRTGAQVVWTSVTLDEPHAFSSTASSQRFRLRFEDVDCKDWQVVEVRFYSQGERLPVGGPHAFASAWKSAGLGEEWLAIDLGAEATVDRVALHWLEPAAEGVVEVSEDGEVWSRVAELSGMDSAGLEAIQLTSPVRARHLRLMMTRPSSAEGYVLSEFEIFGEGGLIAEPRPQPVPAADGSLHLAGGGWRLQRDSEVAGDGAAISTPGYADDDWIVATVPGTVLTSYANIGALLDLNFGANELNISDSFFHADFWYRNELEAPDLAAGQRMFLEFDGVSWKAEVYFNGAKLGRVEGAFHRGRFDVTEHLKPGDTNALAVRVEKPASPGAAKQHTLASAGQNGGAIGADNPSFHASIGWDWIPTIRGRNIGLWNDVRLVTSGPVTLDDPYLRFELPLPDTSSADLLLDVTLNNHGSEGVAGTLRGTFGNVAFEQPVELAGGSAQTVSLSPSTHPQLRLERPKLWWPNGHGEPYLYDVKLELVTQAGASDVESFRSGVRQVTSSEVETDDGKSLRLFVNGRRIVPRGGNWGFSEAHLRYRAREYDTAMRYHRDMNFNMVRNWVGQTGDDELYEAADRHGILIWQDFWLANPWDGPDPADPTLFLNNVRDTIRRIRNHPSVALYCGRNEGDPPPAIDSGIAAAIGELHPGMHYVPNSQFGSVSGGGPYGVRSREYYFGERATPKPHSELGMTSVVTLDSLQRMMPESSLWPMGLHWGLHDFNLHSNQRAEDYVRLIEQGYGGADDLESWLATAQLVNYDGYRAMFEAQSQHRMGLQLWMSHPAWPSLTWQTYDYYFNPHASYFGSKKGSEPLHIQWNPLTDEVEVVNYGVPDAGGLTVEAKVLNLDGSVVWQQEATVDSPYDSTVRPFEMGFPAEVSSVHFIRLRLAQDGEAISENFYWRGTEPGNYRALRTLPQVPIAVSTESKLQGDRYVVTVQLENRSQNPALGVRVVVLREETGDPILPVLYSDNFVPLMPGEQRTIRAEILKVDARGEAPRVVVEGYNVAAAED